MLKFLKLLIKESFTQFLKLRNLNWMILFLRYLEKLPTNLHSLFKNMNKWKITMINEHFAFVLVEQHKTNN